MKKISHFLLWYQMLNKRLLKRISFIIILLLVPVLVVSMTLSAQQESGILKVMLVAEHTDDEFSHALIDSLLQKDSIIHFVKGSSYKEASHAVLTKECDSAWVFPNDLYDRIVKFIENRSESKPVVRIIEREETTISRLSREELFGSLYSHLSYTLYETFIETKLSPDISLPEAVLKEHYHRLVVEESIFDFTTLEGDSLFNENAVTNYLTSPLRGMLAVLLLLCGLAASMFLMNDLAAGRFFRIPKKKQAIFSLGYLLTAITDMGVFVLLALISSGLFISVRRELLPLLLYCICVAAFCNIIRKLTRSPIILGAVIPILLILMLVVCPIFININIPFLQLLLPAYHYLAAVQSLQIPWEMLLYTVLLLLISQSIPERST